MLRHGIRVGVAILTFTMGVAIFWPLRIIQRLETALVDRFDGVTYHDPLRFTATSSAEANEVYRLIIQQIFAQDTQKLIVVRSETTGYSRFSDEALKPDWAFPQHFNKMMKNSMPEVEVQTLSNYLLRNTTGEPLNVWDLGVNYVLANQNDLAFTAGMTQFWSMFHKKFPNSSGLLSFSNVGFNKDHNQALVYAAWNCGDTCGVGEYILLKKVHGKWEIVKEDVYGCPDLSESASSHR
jgi:hypothetical protein